MGRFALFALAAALVLPALAVAPAHAQPFSRTWVSATGNDANNCDRGGPCRTFAGAFVKTRAGGEINCVDSGPFETLTINKAITIACEGSTGGINTAGNAIVITAGASDAVYLKGLDINGSYTDDIGNNIVQGQTGIKFQGAKSLTIEDCHIHGFNLGLDFAPTGPSFLTIINSTLERNGLPNVGGAIRLAPTSSGYGLIAMHNARIVRNYIGIGGSTTGTAIAQIFNSSVANNSSDAISTSGNITVRVGGSMIFGNGGRATSGNVFSFGDNQIVGNNPDTTPSIVALR